MPPPIQAPLGSPDDIEQQFYEALQRADIEQFMAVWADDEEISCVHPGGQRLIGAGAIRAAFEALMGNGAIDLRPERVRRLQTHTCAVHSLIEQIRIKTAEGVQAAWIIVTNVYVKGAQGWRLVAHHASPGAPHESQDVTETASVLH